MYLKELEGELQVVWIHGVDAVLGPLGWLQGVAALGLRVARLVAVGTDHADLQGCGHLVPSWRTDGIVLVVFLLLDAFQCQLDPGQADGIKSEPR